MSETFEIFPWTQKNTENLAKYNWVSFFLCTYWSRNDSLVVGWVSPCNASIEFILEHKNAKEASKIGCHCVNNEQSAK